MRITWDLFSAAIMGIKLSVDIVWRICVPWIEVDCLDLLKEGEFLIFLDLQKSTFWWLNKISNHKWYKPIISKKNKILSRGEAVCVKIKKKKRNAECCEMGYLFCASVNQEKCTNSRDQTYHLLYSFSRTVCDEVQSNRTLSFYFFFFILITQRLKARIHVMQKTRWLWDYLNKIVLFLRLNVVEKEL